MAGRDDRGRLTRTEPTAARPGVAVDELYAKPNADARAGDGAPSDGRAADGGAAEDAAVVQPGGAAGGQTAAPRGGPGSSPPIALKPGTPLLEVFDISAAKGGAKGIELWKRLSLVEQQQATQLVGALKAAGWGIRPIYQRTGLGRGIVERILRDLRERGELKDLLVDVDMECVPQAIDNLRRYLRDGNSDRGERATFKTLEGRGILVAHQKTAGVAIGSMTLEVVDKNAPGDPPAPTGQVFASPRTD